MYKSRSNQRETRIYTKIHSRPCRVDVMNESTSVPR